MNVAALTHRIEASYTVWKSQSTAGLSITGEPFVVIGSQDPSNGPSSIPGTVDEGKVRELASDEETACRQAWSCFLSYAASRTENSGGVLYWRIPPMLEWSSDRTRCAVYMRLLISNRIPVKYAS